MMSTSLRYLEGLQERFARLTRTQDENIRKAAKIAAKTIGNGGLVHLFGTGHGSIPVMEAFPRTGSFVGWNPIVIDAIGPHLRIGGEGSVHQFRFLQGAVGYGKAILDSFPIHEGDAFMLFSHSGVNPVVIEVALAVKEAGHELIAVTSLEHTKKANSRHASGKRLYELADVVIDNCAPFGDASVEIDNLRQPVAACSTSLACAVMDAVLAETADLLVAMGKEPLVLGHIDRKGTVIPDEMRKDYIRSYQDRMWRR